MRKSYIYTVNKRANPFDTLVNTNSEIVFDKH